MKSNPIAIAIAKAEATVKAMVVNRTEVELRAKYKKMSKGDLIEELIALQKLDKGYTIQDIAYAILEDKECAWLTWEMIADIIQKYVPESKTTISSLQWYGSRGSQKGKNVVPRKKKDEIMKVLVG